MPDKQKLWIFGVFAAGAVVLSLWQYQKYRSGFETLTPYQHQRILVDTIPADTETSIPESAAPTESTSCSELSEPSVLPDETQPPVIFPIDLNTADAAMLCELPGIGPVTAQEILDYRAVIGRYTNRRQLLQVSGIAEAKLAEIYELIFVDPEIDDQPATATPPSELVIPDPTDTTEAPAVSVINLNTCTQEQLLQLPGCTESTAAAIIKLRDEMIHVFVNTMEINYAEGVTPVLYYAWEPYLAIDDEGHHSSSETTANE